MPESSRRRFLTGEAALHEVRHAAGKLSEAGAGERPAPRAGETLRLETTAMACSWGVVLNPGPPDRVMAASSALSEVHRIESLLTVYREGGEVATLNRDACGEACSVTPELFELLLTCRRLHDETWRAFDPASHALVTLWRDCRRDNRVPTQTEIDAALAVSGMQHVQLTPRGAGGRPQNTASFDVPGLGLNFGAVGKGYAVDCAAESLRSAGIVDFLIHGGYSSVAAAGGHWGQDGWPVGLKNPLFTDAHFATLLLRDQALGTSGSNIQYFRHGGRRYGHILDPRTGWPAEGLLSVSVVARTALEADALSTAFYVLGLEKSREYCDTHPHVGAVLTPPPARSRRLTPLVCNLPADRLYPAGEDVEFVFESSLPRDPAPATDADRAAPSPGPPLP